MTSLDPWAVLADYGPRYHLLAGGMVEAPAGFSGARVWRVTTPKGTYALRCMDAATVSVSRLRGLHRLLLHLARQGIDVVPVPLAGCDGATVRLLGRHVWQLEPWMPGTADFHANPSGARLDNALICLARVHLAAARFTPDDLEQTWFRCSAREPAPGIASRLRLLGQWTSATRERVAPGLGAAGDEPYGRLARAMARAIDAAAPAVERQLQLAARVVVPLQPCLRDVWHDHVLFSGDEVTGLIDWHACQTDCVAADVARLAGSLVGDDPQAWDRALAAYASMRPFSLDERGLVEVYDRSGVLLSGATWLEWLFLRHRGFADPRKVRQRLEVLAGRLDRLAAAPG